MATLTTQVPDQHLESIQIQDRPAHTIWPQWQLIAFRIATIFILQIIVPLRGDWFERVAKIRALRDFYSAAMAGGLNYISLKSESGRWGVGSFASWGIALAVAIVLGGLWTLLARKSKRKEYTVAYYWLRLAVRYWVAINILHYGYLKLYPMQMPFPSISNLHTLFGEHAAYRLFWQILGFVTWYQVLLGVIEVTAGSLLLFQKTTALGAVLNLGILYNVAHANFAYDGGVHVLSGAISLLSGFLLLQYIPNIYRLIVKKQDVTPSYYHPQFSKPWTRHLFRGAQVAAWIVFIPLYAYASIHGYLKSNFSKEPRSPGLSNAKGYYNVTEFKLNGKTLPYSPLDSERWHDVSFEDYPTLTFKVNKALPIRLENGGPGFKDSEKRYELAGFAGGRTYLHYEIDEVKHTLTLQDKNADVASRDPSSMGRRRGKGANDAKAGKKGEKPVKLVWHYDRISPNRIALSGNTPDKKQFYAVLDRVNENLAINVDAPLQGDALKYDRQFGRRYPLYSRSFDGTADTPNGER